MPLLDLLTSSGRLAYRVRRAGRRVTERYAQPEARQDAAERLARIASPEAVYQLARRFTMTAGNLEQDDQEKRWVRDLLVEIGEPAAAPLERYIRAHDEITWAMDALKELIPAARLSSFLLEVLRDGDPVAIRGAKAAQILEFLGGADIPGVTPGVARCLSSADDTVRIAAVAALRSLGGPEIREPLLEALGSEEEDSARVRIAIAEVFVERGFEVRGRRGAVERALPSGFRVTSRGRIDRVGEPRRPG